MIGQTISHYHILEKLGAGGMGVVYKARDLKLDRPVALKLLPPDLTRDIEARERFIHEAKAASGLQHNNICTVYEIGETDDGELFIAMACYEGQTLKMRIAEGGMQIEEAVEYVIQIAQGLQKAHEKGILHRDIKPANIIVTNDGVAKILDFGLAKLAGGVKLTKTGSRIGTAAYMSPEQARGLEVDHRTDIWSLGVVLFELLTGKLPFLGDHEAAMLYSIVHEEPAQVLEHRLDISVGLALTVSKALQKDPLERYQSMRELIADLKSTTSPSVQLPKQEKSIVVLPFENLSPDPDQEYFSDGLTEEVISDLSNVRALRVISRSSAMTFKGAKKTIPEIARQLNVQYVLEGSVRKSDNSLRITAQLIDAAKDAHLWAEKYSGTLEDVFDIQEKVSRAIVEALKVRLTPAEKYKMAKRPIEDVRAYEYYLKANSDITKRTVEGSEQALRYLQKAVEIIGDSASLYCGMAWAYWNLVNIGAKQEESIIKAEEYVTKALGIDTEFPKAHAMLGWIEGAFRGGPQEAVHHFKKSLAISPDENLALSGLAIVYAQFVGKVEAAIPLAERLVQVNPLDFLTHWIKGGLHFANGRFDLALKPWRELYEMEPENPVAQYYYAEILIYNNEIDRAFAIIEQSAEKTPEHVFTKLGLMLKHALLKDKVRVFQEMTDEFQKTCRRDADYSRTVATVLALLDERQKALDWLENAVSRGCLNYPLLAEKNHFLENLRGEERFKRLMERVKYEWENFEV